MTGDVLVLRALGLGDALAAVAALRGVRRAWPERQITVAGRLDLGRWLHQHRLVDAVLPTSGLAAPLDWPRPPGGSHVSGHVAVNLHGRGPQSHRLLLDTRPDQLVAFDCPATGTPGPEWDADEHEVDRWCRLLSRVGGTCGREDLRLPAPGPRRGHVVVHPGAASPSRRWPPERFAAVVAHLAAAGRRVVVTGTAQEREITAQVCGHRAPVTSMPAAPPAAPGVHDAGGRLDLPALARLVGTADLLVSADTGVAHLATAFATPSVVLFGPTPPRLWGPALDPHLHTTLWHGGPGEYGAHGEHDEHGEHGEHGEHDEQRGDHRGDPHADVLDPVLAAVTVEDVLDAADGLLSASRRRQPAL
ncbi:glycosyltransferase family 9 protein [Sanguibacter suarezii]|uniref:glycosyltransferase family 9 protein n=1 Tax=Sanguibacter suarezii TaxID=60921 RepID=UPI000B051763|nr:glycosyltransferase family 9 protein [Sanguibacter suarezii]